MDIKPLYMPNETITMNTYLEKCGVKNTTEYLKGGAKGIENCDNYDNMNKGYELIKNIIDIPNTSIMILVDIDGDGYYSSAIMYKELKKINEKFNIQPLFHTKRIHGLNDTDVMNKILKDNPSLVICPDSATGDGEQCKILNDNNIPVLILDHHFTKRKNNHAIVINNKLSKNVINKAGSGGVVTWKFCKYIDQKLKINYAPKMIDLVWFSLLSDICEMTTLENRAFAYWGSKNIKNKFLTAMCNKLLKDKEINNHNISWYVQPKISDIIRCEDNKIKKHLFYAIVDEKKADIDIILNNYLKIHNHRKKYVQEYFNQMDKIDDNNKIIFEQVDNLYPYYTGLVGSKINNKYNKPCILYKEPKDNFVTGSIRSPFPIKQQLKDSNLFDFVEGHDSACGCGFKNTKISSIKQFVKNIKLDKSKQVIQSFDANDRIPRGLFSIFDEYKDIWGQGIKEPEFYIYNIKINTNDIKQIGKNKTTIKFNYNGVDYIKFMVSHSDQETKWNIGTYNDIRVEIVGSLGLNEYYGRISPQVVISDYEANLVHKNPIS